MKRFIIVLFGSFFYTGFAAIAPASFASLVWLLVYLFVPGGEWIAGPVALAVTAPVAVYLSWEMEKYYGEDASCIVIDEIVGIQLVLTMAQPTTAGIIAAFFLFRFFDIVKPFPAGRSQNLPEGYGVVTDDVVAGIYTRIVLIAAGWLFPVFGKFGW